MVAMRITMPFYSNNTLVLFAIYVVLDLFSLLFSDHCTSYLRMKLINSLFKAIIEYLLPVCLCQYGCILLSCKIRLESASKSGSPKILCRLSILKVLPFIVDSSKSTSLQ